MTVEKLLNIFQINNIPGDANLESDSGWECGPTDMDGIYYNKSENRVVFTQGYGEDNYCEPEWSLIYKEKSDFSENVNNKIYVDENIMLSAIWKRDSIQKVFIDELKRNNEFELYYGAKESERRYEMINLNQPLFWCIHANWEEDGYYRDEIGYIGITGDDTDIDIEIYIFKEFRRKGFAKKVLQKVIEYIKAGRIKVFDEETQLIKPFTPLNIQAIVREDNLASRALLESCGFKTPECFVAMICVFDEDPHFEEEGITCLKYMCK